ncbi:preprotein translocase subunit TatC [Haloferax mediterranei ATCC 33500]|uniref:Preprotein translocase subunit TatC n=1 Tax=Haloferax mediterranei (strain ATCC 33500 / DSM 1411 / JCM 8866 / NBRC 14739 / NCIMB 2177 / R-4) TaxID=523841 RepID=I3R115_HALMT|nr:twin-arginine translocase subunit TatC [Haloferax mediterranei]AFK17925.1 sec-independent protein translocase component TatC2 [Haloferax mediterranei ATCC 33500]EMA02798.1 Sec-independent periplasmic protein translocase [Haloferax mediterranei ATCC 33500]MDX5988017.1 twin-arginine translocase subunit TatC [Haloferax mediterranei ATCC 33500]QCQ74479.1 preprotein translocase subunit TatC [Haloferax mediterranei ATCC 33500]
MSSALDEDTQQAIASGRETAGAMLRAAQKDLQKVFIVFLIGFLGTFYALSLYVWEFFKGVTKAKMDASTEGALEIIAQTPFDVLLLQAKIALVVGIIFAIPPFIYFSRDALKARNAWPKSPVAPWKLALIGLTMLLLFAGGVAYGYLVFFPFTFEFLARSAHNAGFDPKYSIVKWSQFIFLLTVSFGLASQLPLAVTGLSYTEIVPYELFRDKWRHAVVGIFAVGALFTPPDPFTQIMWAVPVISLYAFSLYLARVVVTAKRGSEKLDLKGTATKHWNLLAGTGVGGGLLVYAFYEYEGIKLANDALVAVGSQYRFLEPGSQLVLSAFIVAGVLVALLLGLAYLVFRDIQQIERTQVGVGDPTKLDLSALDADGIRAAPPEAFADREENEIMGLASAAIDDGDREKAQALIDRFDDSEAKREAAEAEAEESDGLEDRATRAGGAFFDELTEGETDEDDIGGYYKDVSFIVDSVTSRAFWIIGWFMLVLATTFGWLYSGGIKFVYDNFLDRLPDAVTPEEVWSVITLHPMEALVLEVKFSTILAAFATLPLLAYFAWPALRERNIVRRRRRTIYLWVGALGGGLLGGFALGYSYIAPMVITFLVEDAIAANMIISYRITNFFWLIFFTTAGIGLLADVPILMVLLNSAGITYEMMRTRWREVTVLILALSAVFTPASITTMFMVTIPLMVAYGIGLGVLFVITIGGRRDLAPARGAAE